MNETNDITLKCTVPPVLGVTHYKRKIGTEVLCIWILAYCSSRPM